MCRGGASAGAIVLGRSAADEDLHLRSVLLDALAAATSATAIAAAGVIILVTNDVCWFRPGSCTGSVGADRHRRRPTLGEGDRRPAQPSSWCRSS